LAFSITEVIVRGRVAEEEAVENAVRSALLRWDKYWIGLILSIDWLLDRFRTTINVWGDSVGCAVIDRFENKNSPPG